MADPINQLPTMPNRGGDPYAFTTDLDNFLAALPLFRNEVNQVAKTLSTLALNASSTTNNSIGLGALNFSVDTSKSFLPGMTIKVAATASSANWVLGEVTTYDSVTGDLVMNAKRKAGAGNFSNWSISLAADDYGFDGMGAAVASSATPDIWANDGRVRHITGNTAITGWANAPYAGAWMRLIFDADIKVTTQAGIFYAKANDQALILAITANTFFVHAMPKNGQALTATPSINGARDHWDYLKIDTDTVGGATVKINNPVLTDVNGRPLYIPGSFTFNASYFTDRVVIGPSSTKAIFVIAKADGTNSRIVFIDEGSWDVTPDLTAYGFNDYPYSLCVGFVSMVITGLTAVSTQFTKIGNQVQLETPSVIFNGTITANAWTSFGHSIPFYSNKPYGAKKARFLFGTNGTDMGLGAKQLVGGTLRMNSFSSTAVAATANNAGGVSPTTRQHWMHGEIIPDLKQNATDILYWSNSTAGTLLLLGWEE